jgi:hypothetical protein
VIRVDADQLDLHRFERLVSEGRDALADDPAAAKDKLDEAVELWRGPALADFAYESFAQPAIARLDELRLAALELQIEAELALGRHAEVVGRLQELAATYPLREKVRALLMLALYRDGRQADALDTYRRIRAQFVEELGIEPGPALHELERAILEQRPSLSLTTPERSILVAPRNPLAVDALLALAEPLAKRPARELIVAQLTPTGADIAGPAAVLNERRQDLLARGVAARTVAFTSPEPGHDLVRLAFEQDVDLLLIDGDPHLESLDIVLARAPCDVAVHVGRKSPSHEGPVLVLFGGAAHDWAAVELGAWIAAAKQAALWLAGPAEGGGRDASRAVASASLAVQRVFGIAAEPRLLARKEADVLAGAVEAGVVVLGLPERWSRDGLGQIRSALAARARPPALLVRRGLRPGGLAPRESATRFTWTLAPAP